MIQCVDFFLIPPPHFSFVRYTWDCASQPFTFCGSHPDTRNVDDKDQEQSHHLLFPVLTLLTATNFRKIHSFRCHRKAQTQGRKDQTLVYSAKDIKFHPAHGTFTAYGT